MTATATSSSAHTASANGGQAARQPTGSAASAKAAQRNPADLFSNLLGLLSATHDEPLGISGASLLGEAPTDGSDPEDPGSLLSGGSPSSLAASDTPAANPLADLIGWPGAAAAAAAAAMSAPTTPNANAASAASLASQATSAAGSSAQASEQASATPTTVPTSALASTPAMAPVDPDGTTDTAPGLSLQGMTLLAQPTAAEPGMVPEVKTPATGTTLPAASPQGNPQAHTAATTPSKAAADSDAVSVRYSEATAPAPDAETSSLARNNDHVAARPANWRGTTTLATAGTSAGLPGNASTQTAALQNAAVLKSQSVAVQRNPMAETSLPLPRNTFAPNERVVEGNLADAATADWAAVGAHGEPAKGQSHASGGGREDPLLAGTAPPEAADAEAPEEAFSLDAALAAEEELDGTAFLSPNQLRQANVRVGEGTDEAIDIRLSLEGEAVNVEFRTDNAEVRAGLQHNAGASLSDLMQRGGIQLGGVSVGGQSPQSRGQSGQGESAPPRVGPAGGRSQPGARVDETAGPQTRAHMPAARRSDGGPALDIFA